MYIEKRYEFGGKHEDTALKIFRREAKIWREKERYGGREKGYGGKQRYGFA